MSDFSEIKERVRAATHLAELIEREGVKLAGGPAEFRGLCPFHKEKSPSFQVNVEKGIYKCFGCGVSGDVFEFLMQKKGFDFVSALKYAANAIGISVPDSRVQQPGAVREVATPKRGIFDPEKFCALLPDSQAFKYLVEKRKLKPEWLARYSVGQTVEGDAYSFAYKWWPPTRKRVEGARPCFEFCKVVKVDRPDGKKIEWREPKGGKNILYGMTAVPEDAAELVISEGEIDAITWAQYGLPAVSVPNGAGALGWLDICFDWLAPFKKIHLSFDEDRAGREKVNEIITRLGMARADIVRLPEKGGV